MASEEFVKKHPEYIRNKRNQNKIKFVCQCKSGHIFDYRDRIRYLKDKSHYAPCQGKCPYCESNFTFIGNRSNIYPIKWNFT